MKFHFDGDCVTVNVANLAALDRIVRDRLTARQGFALATINLDHMVKLRHDPDFRRVYGAQDIVVADGNPVVWLGRLAGERLALLPGSDLVVPLARLAAETGTGVALVGATGPALEGAAVRLRTEVPGLQVVYAAAPPMGFDPEGPAARVILADLADAGAGLCFVALGAPKQERFAALGRSLCPSVGFASIGAGLDFLAGTQVRAPRWVRRLAMEWLWRLALSPRRLARRYASCALILPGQALSALRQRGDTPRVG